MKENFTNLRILPCTHGTINYNEITLKQSKKIPKYILNRYYKDEKIYKKYSINSISYLTKRTDTITIRKDSDSVSYTVTQREHSIIVGIIFLVPALVIVCGIIVWQIRRRKK